MSTIQIESDNIYCTAVELVTSALATLRLTMHSSDPALPSDYYELLMERAKRGVKIIRIGFGSHDFFRIKSGVHIPHENYSFRFSSSEDYRRMLMADERQLLFKKDGSVYRSDDPEVSRLFLEYFSKI